MNQDHDHEEEHIMPRGDRTGPDGRGPRSGRGAGYCAGYDQPGITRPGGGRGGRRGQCGPGRRRGGRGHGSGRGARSRRGTAPPRQERVDDLRSRADALTAELAAVRRRLDEHTSDDGRIGRPT
ncbi:MAG: DUF5320 domain-containing protein [Planctomycetota bacterium]